jgi:hypothetical protein
MHFRLVPAARGVPWRFLPVTDEPAAAEVEKESMGSGFSFLLHGEVVLKSSGSEEEAVVAAI